MIPSTLAKEHIVKIVEYVEKFFPHKVVNESKKRGRGRIDIFSDELILKILVILKLNNISYRGSEDFFSDNPEYMELLGKYYHLFKRFQGGQENCLLKR